jgi:polyketide biosynthesis enoyl-CoA hydratase PksI
MVRVTSDAGIAHVVLDDPAGRNALGEPMALALEDAFAAVDRDPSVRVVVLGAEGDVFSAGAPRDLLLRLARREVRPVDIQLPRLLLCCPVPVVAAMAGHATGGGFALGLAADIVILAEDSRYGFTFLDLGFTPGMGTTTLAEHVLPAAVAHELLYTGELRRGADLARSGFNHVRPRRDVPAAAMDIAGRIAIKPRVAVEALKRTLSLPRRRAFEHAITTESLMHQITFGETAAARAIEDGYVE